MPHFFFTCLARGRYGRAQGPGLLFGLAGNGALSQAGQLLFVTSLFAAALAFHNVVWRYVFALGRENVLPAAFGRTSGTNIPRAASLAQSAIGLAVILTYATGGWPPMTDLLSNRRSSVGEDCAAGGRGAQPFASLRHRRRYGTGPVTGA